MCRTCLSRSHRQPTSTCSSPASPLSWSMFNLQPGIYILSFYSGQIVDGDSLAHTKLTQLRTQDSVSLAHTKVSQLCTQSLRGMGWGSLTSLSFLLSSRHRHCSFMISYRWVGVGWGNNVHVPVHTQAQA